MSLVDYVFDDRVAYNNGQQRRHRVRQCDRFPFVVGIYNSRRKDGDGQHRADNVTHNLGLSVEFAFRTVYLGYVTLFLRRRTSGSQLY